MVVTYKDDVTTLDPAIGYDWQNWSIIKSLFDGLMDYKPGTMELVPDLAESYDISPDGQTYTFKVRSGVKFHNGRELTAEDIKYSIERVRDPATQSPGAGFFGSIASIEVPEPHTIVFKLSRPDATFLHVMAINFAHAVPKEEPIRTPRCWGQEGSDRTSDVPATRQAVGEFVKRRVPLAGAYSNPHVQEQVTHLARLADGSLGGSGR